MKWLAALLLSLSCNVSLLAQEPSDTLQHPSFVKGVHVTLEELQNNAPSITEFKITSPPNIGVKATDSYWRDIVHYQNKRGKTKLKNSSHFVSYSDGNDLYIGTYQFHKVKSYGTICLFYVEEKYPDTEPWPYLTEQGRLYSGPWVPKATHEIRPEIKYRPQYYYNPTPVGGFGPSDPTMKEEYAPIYTFQGWHFINLATGDIKVLTAETLAETILGIDNGLRYKVKVAKDFASLEQLFQFVEEFNKKHPWNF